MTLPEQQTLTISQWLKANLASERWTETPNEHTEEYKSLYYNLATENRSTLGGWAYRKWRQAGERRVSDFGIYNWV